MNTVDLNRPEPFDFKEKKELRAYYEALELLKKINKDRKRVKNNGIMHDIIPSKMNYE